MNEWILAHALQPTKPEREDIRFTTGLTKKCLLFSTNVRFIECKKGEMIEKLSKYCRRELSS